MEEWWMFEDVTVDINDSCSGDLFRESCQLSPSELGERHAIAAIRAVVSSLSIMGAVTIIISSIKSGQVWSSKVHPIFQLSIADALLGVLWITGSVLWLRGAPNRAWCYAVSLPTVILQCVAVNLTLVYAITSYQSIKKKAVGNVMEIVHDTSTQSRPKQIVVTCCYYIIAWTLPLIIIMVVFGSVASITGVVRDTNDCSCWCPPLLGNILPYAVGKDYATAVFARHVRMIILSYGLLLLFNYLVVFVFLIIIYQRILKHIRSIRDEYARLDPAMHGVLKRGHSSARRRIVYYLLVFIVSGLAHFLLSLVIVIYEGRRIHSGPVVLHPDDDSESSYGLYISLYIMQSLTVPLQGFLNAIVYGWTRDDFLQAVRGPHTLAGAESSDVDIIRDGEAELQYTASRSTNFEDRSSKNSGIFKYTKYRAMFTVDATGQAFS